MERNYTYDVALSFAGEDREYVDKVAHTLRDSRVRVHYDEFFQADMWGMDLIEHFDDIYRHQARYCVMFISENYVRKAWPSHEKRSALARELIDTGYILPARFDDTDVLGLPPSKAYVDLTVTTPEQLASLIVQKLGKSASAPPPSIKPEFRRPKVARSFDPYKKSQAWLKDLVAEMDRRCRESDISFSHFNRDGKECLRFVANGKVVYSINIGIGGFHQDHGYSFSYSWGEMQMFSGINGWAEFEWDKERDCLTLKIQDFSVTSQQAAERKHTKPEFFDYIWNKFCNALEGRL